MFFRAADSPEKGEALPAASRKGCRLACAGEGDGEKAEALRDAVCARGCGGSTSASAGAACAGAEGGRIRSLASRLAGRKATKPDVATVGPPTGVVGSRSRRCKGMGRTAQRPAWGRKAMENELLSQEEAATARACGIGVFAPSDPAFGEKCRQMKLDLPEEDGEALMLEYDLNRPVHARYRDRFRCRRRLHCLASDAVGSVGADGRTPHVRLRKAPAFPPEDRFYR